MGLLTVLAAEGEAQAFYRAISDGVGDVVAHAYVVGLDIGKARDLSGDGGFLARERDHGREGGFDVTEAEVDLVDVFQHGVDIGEGLGRGHGAESLRLSDASAVDVGQGDAYPSFVMAGPFDADGGQRELFSGGAQLKGDADIRLSEHHLGELDGHDLFALAVAHVEVGDLGAADGHLLGVGGEADEQAEDAGLADLEGDARADADAFLGDVLVLDGARAELGGEL